MEGRQRRCLTLCLALGLQVGCTRSSTEPQSSATHAGSQGYVVTSQVLPTAIRVQLVATNGYHINADFPTELKVRAEEPGVVIAKSKFGRHDAVVFGDKEATFVVAFTTKAQGPKHLSAVFKFAVCTQTVCEPKHEVLAWVIGKNNE